MKNSRFLFVIALFLVCGSVPALMWTSAQSVVSDDEAACLWGGSCPGVASYQACNDKTTCIGTTGWQDGQDLTGQQTINWTSCGGTGCAGYYSGHQACSGT